MVSGLGFGDAVIGIRVATGFGGGSWCLVGLVGELGTGLQIG